MRKTCEIRSFYVLYCRQKTVFLEIARRYSTVCLVFNCRAIRLIAEAIEALWGLHMNHFNLHRLRLAFRSHCTVYLLVGYKQLFNP
jgi:hypothetical protein